MADRFRGWSPLSTFLLEQARTLEREAFMQRHPDRILLVPLVQARDPTRPTTRVMRADPAESARMNALPFDLVPLQKKPTNPAANLITVGRAESNDIVIGSSEISKLHALFMLDPTSGHVTVTDAGSTNGTKVDGRLLRPREEAHTLVGGEALAFGTVKVVYHEPRTLWEFLRGFSDA